LREFVAPEIEAIACEAPGFSRGPCAAARGNQPGQQWPQILSTLVTTVVSTVAADIPLTADMILAANAEAARRQRSLSDTDAPIEYGTYSAA
jgi:hypothetical protein